MKMFIVEDVPQTRQALAEIFAAQEGFQLVGQAGSVREALDGLQAIVPDAMTLDISLPDGSGLAVLQHVRRCGWETCVVVLTAHPYEALRTRCYTLGATAVLDKFDGLDQALRAVLARCKNASENGRAR